MKATLTFDLPEEQTEHQMAVQAWAAHAVIDDIDQWLRGKIKYGHEFKTADDALEQCRQELHGIINDRQLVRE